MYNVYYYYYFNLNTKKRQTPEGYTIILSSHDHETRNMVIMIINILYDECMVLSKDISANQDKKKLNFIVPKFQNHRYLCALF